MPSRHRPGLRDWSTRSRNRDPGGGDADAFVEMIRRHEAAVGAYLARRAGRDLAEDLLGEVGVAALSSRGTYDHSFPDARPWLFGVAHNMLRRHWRSLPVEEPVADLAERAPGWDPWALTMSGLPQAIAGHDDASRTGGSPA